MQSLCCNYDDIPNHDGGSRFHYASLYTCPLLPHLHTFLRASTISYREIKSINNAQASAPTTKFPLCALLPATVRPYAPSKCHPPPPSPARPFVRSLRRRRRRPVIRARALHTLVGKSAVSRANIEHHSAVVVAPCAVFAPFSAKRGRI